jgi:DNA polymerase III epsilon subunit-like protein
MLSFAMTVVGRYDGRSFERVADRAAVFVRELQPISEDFEPEALAVNGLDRDSLREHGARPEQAMDDASAWVRDQVGTARAVLVAYPVAFDWSFLYWYFQRYSSQGSPFGHSSCLDIRTFFLASAGTVFDEAGKERMPSFLKASAPHTHHALDDAVEQGQLFANLFEWSLSQRLRQRHRSSGAPAWLTERVVPIV